MVEVLLLDSNSVVSYWNGRRNPNSASGLGTKRHVDFIREHTKDCFFVCDYGCGVGRILGAFNKDQFIFGVDIVSRYRDRWLKQCRKLGLHGYHYLFDPGVGVSGLSDKCADVVVCVSVLHHQSGDMLVRVCKEILRIGKKVVVIGFYYPDRCFGKVSDFNFNHDYKSVFGSLGADFDVFECVGNQLFMVVKLNYNCSL